MKAKRTSLSPAVFAFSFDSIQPLAGWPGPHLWRRNNLLAKWGKRGGACLHAHDLSSFPATRPESPTGVLASGTGSTDFSLCNLLVRSICNFFQVLSHGLFAGLFCALTVGGGAEPSESAESSEEALLFPLVTPENAECITSFAKKFFPSIGTIMICSLSESLSAIIF